MQEEADEYEYDEEDEEMDEEEKKLMEEESQERNAKFNSAMEKLKTVTEQKTIDRETSGTAIQLSGSKQ